MAFSAGKMLRRAQDSEIRTHKTLQPGEAFTVPSRVRHLAVVNGKAWVSMNAEDLIIEMGQWRQFEAADKPVVVSSLGNTAVELEMME